MARVRLKELPRECKVCENIYWNPCDGENKKCINYLWIKKGNKPPKKKKGKAQKNKARVRL